jgi:hypothetical protein
MGGIEVGLGYGTVIDLPLIYYYYVGKVLKQKMYTCGGLNPSWLIEPVEYPGDFSIPEEDREYGGRIYPFELKFCYDRMFR